MFENFFFFQFSTLHMSLVVYNKKRRARGAPIKNGKKCFNQLKHYKNEAPLRLFCPKSTFPRRNLKQKLTVLHGDRKNKKKSRTHFSYGKLNFICNPDLYGFFFIFLLFLPPCETVNFRLKFHLVKEDFGKTSLRGASFMKSFNRLHFLSEPLFHDIYYYTQLHLF